MTPPKAPCRKAGCKAFVQHPSHNGQARDPKVPQRDLDDVLVLHQANQPGGGAAAVPAIAAATGAPPEQPGASPPLPIPTPAILGDEAAPHSSSDQIPAIEREVDGDVEMGDSGGGENVQGRLTSVGANDSADESDEVAGALVSPRTGSAPVTGAKGKQKPKELARGDRESTEAIRKRQRAGDSLIVQGRAEKLEEMEFEDDVAKRRVAYQNACDTMLNQGAKLAKRTEGLVVILSAHRQILSEHGKTADVLPFFRSFLSDSVKVPRVALNVPGFCDPNASPDAVPVETSYVEVLTRIKAMFGCLVLAEQTDFVAENKRHLVKSSKSAVSAGKERDQAVLERNEALEREAAGASASKVELERLRGVLLRTMTSEEIDAALAVQADPVASGSHS